jgi:hypothetical protein
VARNHRNYENSYPSVTTVLGILRKPGLEYWMKINTLKFINDATAKGKLIGTQTHEAIENYINTGVAKIETDYPDEVTFALKSFMKFRNDRPDLEIKTSEVALVSEIYKFNGTIDAPQPPNLFDWKSGEAKKNDAPAIYDEWKFQCSAYVHLWNENNPSSPINKVYIVAIAKDKVAYSICEMDEQEIKDCFNEVFLPCLQITKYQRRK